ncbi:hypothetical protein [Mycobacterium sp. E740]|uniref:hypothetical protein n=1 Tax=Mycobacterium sp. E740 TaxID=1834149 RepID=UPI001E48F360|nr:hypothetical protein [Mycobacterium sp. E740]
MAATLLTGLAVPNATAQPTDPKSCTGEDCKQEVDQVTMTADQALAIIQNEYAQGDGGGQLSQLIDDVMKLRAQGFRPSNANKLAIQNALAHRPNQTPLVEALKETLAYQRKLQARAAQAAADKPVAGNVPVIPGMTMPVG